MRVIGTTSAATGQPIIRSQSRRTSPGRRAFPGCRAASAEAECAFADVVRVRCLLPDRADFEPCWPVLRRVFGGVRPAATMLVCGLSDPRMKIEIEVDARRPAA
ncbi:Rid family hydrolase [Streptomyces sp. NPDC015184]|uniref:Rid family hydrolase n=1 Tax=Streptomyces sp. NPDC015184 TaxID=3364946 RepID=UPI0036FF350C